MHCARSAIDSRVDSLRSTPCSTRPFDRRRGRAALGDRPDDEALATASVTDQQVPTAQAVRNLVNAYNEILAAADGSFDADPIQAADYTLLGITGVVGNDAKVRLLSDVIDRKINSAVDTADELQALASIVTAVMNSAAETAGGLTSPDRKSVV